MEKDARSMYDQLVSANIERLRKEHLNLDDLVTRHNAVASKFPPSIEQLTEQDALLALVEELSDIPACPLELNDLPSMRQINAPPKVRLSKLRVVTVAVALFIALTIVAAAAHHFFSSVNLNIQDETADWVASLGSSGVLEMPIPNEQGYASLADALAQNFAGTGAPQWLPPRFSLDSIDLYETSTKISYVAWYTVANGDGLSIMIEQYSNGIPESVVATTEKSEGSKYYVDPDGVTYYYYANGELWVGTWAVRDCIATVSGNVSEDEMASILKSIYKGGP